MPYTSRQKLDSIERDLKLRRYVYPREIWERKMLQEEADYQIALFEDIAADYGGKRQGRYTTDEKRQGIARELKYPPRPLRSLGARRETQPSRGDS